MAAWKKLVGAFVKLDEDTPSPSGAPTDPEEIEKLLAEVRGGKPKPPSATSASPTPAAPVAVPSTPLPAGVPSDVVEGRAFDDIYKAAGVPPSPHPAEKLLKVLTGLGAMPVDTRRTVVAAMDEADESWTIADPVLDAQNKVAALQAEKARISASVQAAEAQALNDNKAQDDYLLQATSEIRRQIAELQATLEAEISGVSKAKSEIDSRLKATREAATREAARLDQEATRLNQVPTTFGTPTPSSPPNRS